MAALDALEAVYDRTYGSTPGKAARRLMAAAVALEEAEAALEKAVAGGDDQEAEKLQDKVAEIARQVDALQGVLDRRARCRRCGRALKDPVSVARQIGPECLNKGAL